MADTNPPKTGMIKYSGYVSIGLVGCRRKFEFEIEADATDEEVEEAGRDAMFNIIEWYYSVSEDN